MNNSKPIIVVFPYIELSVPLEIRGEVLFPSNFLTLTHETIDNNDHWHDQDIKKQLNNIKSHLNNNLGYNEEFFEAAKLMLKDIQDYFYWYTNKKVENITWCFLPESANQIRRHRFKTHLEEIKKILGYIWCVQDTRPLYFSLYGYYEQLDYYSFIPENAIWEGGVNCITHLSLQSHEDGGFKYVKGYIYSLNEETIGNIIEGCRIYPSTNNIINRGGDGLPRILDFHSDKASSILLLFNLDNISNNQTERIFDALEWYNRSCYSKITSDMSIIYLAIGFEALLMPTRERGNDDKIPKQQHLYNFIRLIVGDVSRLDEWVTQFYHARSRIIHEGKWSQTKLVIENKSNKISSKDEFGSLTYFGWMIFRICLSPIINGLAYSSAVNLQARFFSNQDRLKHIFNILTQTITLDPYDVINVLIDNIKVLADTHMMDNHSIEIGNLWNIGKLLAERLTPVIDEPEERNALAQVVDRYHAKFDDAAEIIEYTLLIFQNTIELPYEKVRKPAIEELSSAKPPSLQKIRKHIRFILKRNKNEISSNLCQQLENIIKLINCSFFRFQVAPIIELSENFPGRVVNRNHPFTLMHGYSKFVHEVTKNTEVNARFVISHYKLSYDK